ncbi:MAG TPA: tetratricopeptide repeat protein, partial [Bacteroidia bacterium]|nr:tetratricopeptide repeat protein [Bacteroidia bacterium]
KFLYLIPVIIGAFFKQTAIIFPALLAVYVFLFENKDADRNVVRKIFRTALTIIPALIECIVLYRLQAKLTPQTYITGGSTFNYIITQPFVILHYFITFFFPFDLSADSDWVPLASIASAHFLIGMAFVVMLFVIAFTLLRNIKYSPIVFGIAWFLIALIPSTFIPLAEVMNDHRAFFPYIGIAIAMGWIAFFIWERIESHYIKAFKATLVLVLILNAAGTFARNFVWHNEESLWYDVSLKSPNNGRGLMNYGLSLMAKRDYTGAETYYTKAIDLMPYYPYVYENMAILKAAQGQTDLADKYYKQALDLDSGVPILHYYYAKFLHEQGKDDDAITHLQKAIVLSTGDIDSRYLLMEIYKDEQNWPALKQAAIETLSVLPNDVTASNYLTNSVGGEYRMKIALDSVKVHPTATNYITLSLIYYGQKDYKQCIEASEKAISLDVNNYTAYNNMGSAYNMLGDWKNAADALDKALKLKPDFELAKNNYVLSLKEIAVTDSMNRVVQNNPTPENYINLSLLYYRQNLFLKSIDACKQALRLNPSYTLAYNNMCAAYNKLKMWDEAIDAGTNAMRLEPNNQLVKNNLAEARKGKEGIRN